MKKNRNKLVRYAHVSTMRMFRNKALRKVLATWCAFATLVTTASPAWAATDMLQNAQVNAASSGVTLAPGSLDGTGTATVTGGGAGVAGVLDWNTLNVGANETLNFKDGTFYNVVNSMGGMTTIAGMLNGTDADVMIFNPNGVTMKNGSVVNVSGIFGAFAYGIGGTELAGWVADPGSVPAAMLGNQTLSKDITVEGGAQIMASSVALAGANVSVGGTAQISGAAKLAAGDVIQIDSISGGSVSFEIPEASVSGDVNLLGEFAAALEAQAAGNVTVAAGALTVDGGLTVAAGKGSSQASGQFVVNNATVTVDGNLAAQAAGNVGVLGKTTLKAKTVKLEADGTIGVTKSAAGDLPKLTATDGDLTLLARGVSELTGNGIELEGDLIVGDLIVSEGNLNLTATKGAIAQEEEASISVNGATTVEAAGDVSLVGQKNDFVGKVNVTAAKDVKLSTATELTLGNITASGDLTVTADAGSSQASAQITAGDATVRVGGEITATATGNITVTGETTLEGKAVTLEAGRIIEIAKDDEGPSPTLTATEGDITLRANAFSEATGFGISAEGTFAGELNATATAGNIKIDAADDVDVGTIVAEKNGTAVGNVTIDASGVIDMTGGTTVHGKDVTLTATATATDGSGSVSIQEANVKAENDLTVTADDDIDIDGATVTAGGNASLTVQNGGLTIKNATEHEAKVHAVGNLVLSATSDGIEGVTLDSGAVSAGGNVRVAGPWVEIWGASVTAGKNATVVATGDDDIESGETLSEAMTVAGTVRANGGSVVVKAAQGSITLTDGSTLAAKSAKSTGTDGNVLVEAKRNVTVGTADGTAAAITADGAGTADGVVVLKANTGVNVVNGTIKAETTAVDMEYGGEVNLTGTMNLTLDAGANDVTVNHQGGTLTIAKGTATDDTVVNEVTGLASTETRDLSTMGAAGAGLEGNNITINGANDDIAEADGAAVIASGKTTLTATAVAAGAGSITLDSALNDFGGTVNVVDDASGNHVQSVTLVNKRESGKTLSLGSVCVAGALDATAYDILIENGAAVSAGTTAKFTADQNVTVQGASVTAGGDLTATAGHGISVGGTDVAASTVKSTAGDVTLDGAALVSVGERGTVAADAGSVALKQTNADKAGTTAIHVDRGTVTAAKTVTMTAEAGDITVDGTKTVAASVSGKDIEITANDGSVNLGNSTLKDAATLKASGTLTVTAEKGNIAEADTAAITAVGTATFKAQNIDVKSMKNDFAKDGESNLAKVNATATAGNITIGEKNTIRLGVVKASGDVTVNAGNKISLSGADSSLTAENAVLNAGLETKDAESSIKIEINANVTVGSTFLADAYGDISILEGAQVVANGTEVATDADALTLKAENGTVLIDYENKALTETRVKATAGNLSVTAGRIAITDGARVETGAGNVALTAKDADLGDVTIDNATVKAGDFTATKNADGTVTYVQNTVGNLTIDANANATLQNGAQVGASGTANVKARTKATVTGADTTLAANGALTLSGKSSAKKSGEAEVSYGATVAGNLTVTLEADKGLTVDAATVAAKGDLTVNAGSILVQNAAKVGTDANATLTSKKSGGLTVQSGAQVLAANDLTLTAEKTGGDITIEGENTLVKAGKFSVSGKTVTSTSNGKLTIDSANHVTIQNGATVAANGKDGDDVAVAIDASKDIEITGSDTKLVANKAMTIDTHGDLTIQSGAYVGGNDNVTIGATKSPYAMTVTGSGTTLGAGRNLNAQAASITIADGAKVASDATSDDDTGTTLKTLTGDLEVKDGASVLARKNVVLDSVANLKLNTGANVAAQSGNVTANVAGETLVEKATVAAGNNVDVNGTGKITVDSTDAKFTAGEFVTIDGQNAVEIKAAASIAAKNVRIANESADASLTDDEKKVTIGGNVVADGNVTVIAKGSVAQNANLTAGNAAATSGGGSVYVEAKDGGITLAAGVVTTAQGSKGSTVNGNVLYKTKSGAIQGEDTTADNFATLKSTEGLVKLESETGAIGKNIKAEAKGFLGETTGEGSTVYGTLVGDVTVAYKTPGNVEITHKDGTLTIANVGKLGSLYVNKVLADLTLAADENPEQVVLQEETTATKGITATDVKITGENDYITQESDAVILAHGVTTISATRGSKVIEVGGTSVNGDISLTSANDFQGKVHATGENITLNDVNELNLGDVTAEKALKASANGILVDDGATVTAKGTGLAATDTAIDLAATENVVIEEGTVTADNGGIAATAGHAVDVRSDVGSGVTKVTATTGDIRLEGGAAVSVNNGAEVTATAGDVTLVSKSATGSGSANGIAIGNGAQVTAANTIEMTADKGGVTFSDASAEGTRVQATTITVEAKDDDITVKDAAAIQASGALTMKAGTATDAYGSILLQNSASVTAGSTLDMTAERGDIVEEDSTASVEAGGTATFLAESIKLIGVNDLSKNGGADLSKVNATATEGNILINDKNTIRLGEVTAYMKDAQQVEIDAGEDIQLKGSGTALKSKYRAELQTSDGTVTIKDGATVTVDQALDVLAAENIEVFDGATVTAGSVDIETIKGSVEVNGDNTADSTLVQTTVGGLSITACEGVTIGKGATVDAKTDLTVTAQGDTTGAGLTIRDANTKVKAGEKATLTADEGDVVVMDQASVSAGTTATLNAKKANVTVTGQATVDGAMVGLTAGSDSSATEGDVTVSDGAVVRGNTQMALLAATHGNVTIDNATVAGKGGVMAMAATTFTAENNAVVKAGEIDETTTPPTWSGTAALAVNAATIAIQNDAKVGASGAATLTATDTTVDNAQFAAGKTLAIEAKTAGAGSVTLKDGANVAANETVTIGGAKAPATLTVTGAGTALEAGGQGLTSGDALKATATAIVISDNAKVGAGATAAATGYSTDPLGNATLEATGAGGLTVQSGAKVLAKNNLTLKADAAAITVDNALVEGKGGVTATAATTFTAENNAVVKAGEIDESTTPPTWSGTAALAVNAATIAIQSSAKVGASGAATLTATDTTVDNAQLAAGKTLAIEAKTAGAGSVTLKGGAYVAANETVTIGGTAKPAALTVDNATVEAKKGVTLNAGGTTTLKGGAKVGAGTSGAADADVVLNVATLDMQNATVIASRNVDVNADGAITVNSDAAKFTAGEFVTIDGKDAVNITKVASIAAKNVRIANEGATTAKDVTIGGNVVADGNVTVIAKGSVAQNANLTAGNAAATSGGGSVYVEAKDGGITLAAGVVTTAQGSKDSTVNGNVLYKTKSGAIQGADESNFATLKSTEGLVKLESETGAIGKNIKAEAKGFLGETTGEGSTVYGTLVGDVTVAYKTPGNVEITHKDGTLTIANVGKLGSLYVNKVLADLTLAAAENPEQVELQKAETATKGITATDVKITGENDYITQDSDAVILARGVTTISATSGAKGNGDINLYAQNDFQGKVHATAENVTLNDVNELNLGDVTAAAALKATAVDVLIDKGATVSAGTTADFTATRNVMVNGDASVTAFGNLTAKADHEVSVDGSLDETRRTTVQSTSGDVTLEGKQGVQVTDGARVQANAADKTVTLHSLADVTGQTGVRVDGGEVRANNGTVAITAEKNAVLVTGADDMRGLVTAKKVEVLAEDGDVIVKNAATVESDGVTATEGVLVSGANTTLKGVNATLTAEDLVKVANGAKVDSDKLTHLTADMVEVAGGDVNATKNVLVDAKTAKFGQGTSGEAAKVTADEENVDVNATDSIVVNKATIEATTQNVDFDSAGTITVNDENAIFKAHDYLWLDALGSIEIQEAGTLDATYVRIANEYATSAQDVTISGDVTASGNLTIIASGSVAQNANLKAEHGSVYVSAKTGHIALGDDVTTSAYGPKESADNGNVLYETFTADGWIKGNALAHKASMYSEHGVVALKAQGGEIGDNIKVTSALLLGISDGTIKGALEGDIHVAYKTSGDVDITHANGKLTIADASTFGTLYANKVETTATTTEVLIQNAADATHGITAQNVTIKGQNDTITQDIAGEAGATTSASIDAAQVTTLESSGTIDLRSLENNFKGNVNAKTTVDGNITINGKNQITFDQVEAQGVLNSKVVRGTAAGDTGAGDILDAVGAKIVAKKAANLEAQHDINLDSALNDFQAKVNATVTDGDVTIRDSGDISLGTVSAANGTATIYSKAGTVKADAGANVDAINILLKGEEGTAGVAVTDDADVHATQDIKIETAGDIVVNGASAKLNADRHLLAQADGNITLTQAAKIYAADNVRFANAGTDDAGVKEGTPATAKASDITIGTKVEAGKNVTFVANRDVAQNADIYADCGSVWVQAVLGSITMAENVKAQSDGGPYEPGATPSGNTGNILYKAGLHIEGHGDTDDTMSSLVAKNGGYIAIEVGDKAISTEEAYFKGVKVDGNSVFAETKGDVVATIVGTTKVSYKTEDGSVTLTHIGVDKATPGEDEYGTLHIVKGSIGNTGIYVNKVKADGELMSPKYEMKATTESDGIIAGKDVTITGKSHSNIEIDSVVQAGGYDAEGTTDPYAGNIKISTDGDILVKNDYNPSVTEQTGSSPVDYALRADYGTIELTAGRKDDGSAADGKVTFTYENADLVLDQTMTVNAKDVLLEAKSTGEHGSVIVGDNARVDGKSADVTFNAQTVELVSDARDVEVSGKANLTLNARNTTEKGVEGATEDKGASLYLHAKGEENGVDDDGNVVVTTSGSIKALDEGNTSPYRDKPDATDTSKVSQHAKLKIQADAGAVTFGTSAKVTGTTAVKMGTVKADGHIIVDADKDIYVNATTFEAGRNIHISNQVAKDALALAAGEGNDILIESKLLAGASAPLGADKDPTEDPVSKIDGNMTIKASKNVLINSDLETKGGTIYLQAAREGDLNVGSIYLGATDSATPNYIISRGVDGNIYMIAEADDANIIGAKIDSKTWTHTEVPDGMTPVNLQAWGESQEVGDDMVGSYNGWVNMQTSGSAGSDMDIIGAHAGVKSKGSVKMKIKGDVVLSIQAAGDINVTHKGETGSITIPDGKSSYGTGNANEVLSDFRDNIKDSEGAVVRTALDGELTPGGHEMKDTGKGWSAGGDIIVKAPGDVDISVDGQMEAGHNVDIQNGGTLTTKPEGYIQFGDELVIDSGKTPTPINLIPGQTIDAKSGSGVISFNTVGGNDHPTVVDNGSGNFYFVNGRITGGDSTTHALLAAYEKAGIHGIVRLTPVFTYAANLFPVNEFTDVQDQSAAITQGNMTSDKGAVQDDDDEDETEGEEEETADADEEEVPAEEGQVAAK